MSWSGKDYLSARFQKGIQVSDIYIRIQEDGGASNYTGHDESWPGGEDKRQRL
jgi:hypothetical protein